MACCTGTTSCIRSGRAQAPAPSQAATAGVGLLGRKGMTQDSSVFQSHAAQNFKKGGKKAHAPAPALGGAHSASFHAIQN